MAAMSMAAFPSTTEASGARRSRRAPTSLLCNLCSPLFESGIAKPMMRPSTFPQPRGRGSLARHGVSSHLRYRQIGDVFVFLDLRASRYFLMREHAAQRFSRFLAGASSPSDLDWFLRHGLVSPRAPARQQEHVVPSVRSSIFDSEMPLASFCGTGAAIAAQVVARYDLRFRSLDEILGTLESRTSLTPISAPEACLPIAAAFFRARHYLPAIDQCLARGLAMKRLLCRQRRQATLVIGVRLPFSAHCWVQAGDLLLTDPIDVVLPFEPILAV